MGQGLPKDTLMKGMVYTVVSIYDSSLSFFLSTPDHKINKACTTPTITTRLPAMRC